METSGKDRKLGRRGKLGCYRCLTHLDNEVAQAQIGPWRAVIANGDVASRNLVVKLGQQSLHIVRLKELCRLPLKLALFAL